MQTEYAIFVPSASMNVRHNRLYISSGERYTRTMKLRLKELRKERGWTQKHVADLANMSVSYYADIERGDKQINQNRLEALAKAYDVPVSALLADDSGSDDVRLFSDIQKLNAPQRKAVQDLIQNLAGMPE